MTALGSVAETGREVMLAIQDGTLAPPPFADLLGLEVLEVDTGRVVFGFRTAERFSNWTTTHGGALAGVADFALTTAVLSALPAGTHLVTANLAISYLRPLALDAGPARCEGRLVHLGRSLAHAEATLTDDQGREVLRATATCHHRGPHTP